MTERKHTFKLSDESLNRYGFWVLTSGLLLDSFKKNPVMLYDHEKWGVLPIGRWTNIRIENKVLMADAEFDMDDEYAAKIAGKVEKGFLRGCSIGFNITEKSEDKKFLKPGQTRPTVVKAEVMEASITAFPGNKNALKLSCNGRQIQLHAGTPDEEIDKLLKPVNIFKMDKIKTMLGLSAGATEEQVETALQNLIDEKTELSAKAKTANDKIAELTGKDAKRNGEMEKIKSERKLALETIGKLTGGINDENREKVNKLADADFDLALSFIGAEKTEKKEEKKEAPLRMSDVIAALNNLGTGANGKTEETPDFAKMSYGERIAWQLSQRHQQEETK